MIRSNINFYVRLLTSSLILISSNAYSQDILFEEDFESIELGESVEEGIFEDEVWAPTYEGWDVVNMIPGQDEDADFNGVDEWIGWVFADKQWWTDTAQDQRRSEFTLGDGTVMIADPDEWDDLPHPDSAAEGWYNTYITTPSINIAGVSEGSIKVKFDSSWRPEFDDNYQQSANLTVKYDDAEPVEVLRWLSDPDSDFFKDDIDPDESTNEEVILSLANPGGVSNMSLTFGMFDAGNDWWWAIDNILITGNAGDVVRGDFNGDGAIDAADATSLNAQIASGANDPSFDLTGDGAVNGADLTVWVKDIKTTWFGDANLDGEFNSSDFVAVFQAGKFELDQDAGWDEGDWNGDGRFGSGDFVAAFQDGGFEQGPVPGAQSVPEPSGIAVVVITLLMLGSRRKS